MAVTIPVTGGVIQAVEGETYILSPNTTGNIIFQGDAAFTVEVNDNQTFTTADNARVIRFDAGTDPTVNFAAGVDSTTHLIDANGDSLTVNMGDGANVGTINADSVTGPDGFVLNGGNGVTVTGTVNGPNGTSPTTVDIGDDFTQTVRSAAGFVGSARGTNTMTFGDNMDIAGRLTAVGPEDATLNVGSGAKIGVDLDLRGGGDRDVTFGDNLELTGNIDGRSSGADVKVNLGDNALVTGNISFAASGSSILNIGADLEVRGTILGSNGIDNFTIGNNWFVRGNIDMAGANDQLSLGFQSDSTSTVVTGNTGVDGLTVTAPPSDAAAFIQAATDAGWTDNGDGTVSPPDGNVNALNIFDFGGVRYQLFEGPGNPICFTAGTQITVANGATVAVEDLRQGDMVMTADHGLQEIKWTGTNTLAGAALEDNMRPIRISAGALGGGLPLQDLLVSPQHRVLVCSSIAQKMFGEDEVLVAAKHLVLIDGIDVVADAEEVTYVHFLCDQHEVVFANGAASESLFTGPQALKSVSGAAVVEIMSLFPELADVDYKAMAARKLSNGRMGRQLAVRHKNNNRPLLPTRH